MNAKLRQIKSLAAEVFTDEATLAAFSRAACYSGRPGLLPLAVVRPRQMNELARLLQFCRQEGIPLAIRGGGTTPDCANVPAAPETLLIVTTGLNRIYELDRETRIARLQPGVTCAALQQKALQAGLVYPLLPEAASVSTIGGNIAMNVAAPASFRYGPPGSWVSQLEAFLSSGERLLCPGQNGSLFAGFPLAPLFCGSAGCLGLIGDLWLKLLPAPAARRDLLAAFPDEQTAASACCAVLAQVPLPVGVQYFDGASAAALGRPASPLLALSWAGNQQEAEPAADLTEKLQTDYGAEITDRSGFSPSGLWPALAASGRRFVLERLVFPADRLESALRGVRDLAADLRMETAISGSVANGEFQAAFFPLPEEKRREELRTGIFRLELMLNELFSGEDDGSEGRQAWQEQQKLFTVTADLRRLFDPAGLLSAHSLPR